MQSFIGKSYDLPNSEIIINFRNVLRDYFQYRSNCLFLAKTDKRVTFLLKYIYRQVHCRPENHE
ncbi:hypothetical protein P5673_031508 [Acropora cervicornis]|uniref:Uncharacterized protein n=1 Tax=Acropora cervicornis TaxID=6130 RepID=A0AAD9PSV5_ACRCE|nr:hypothetical protein P5673_031508 [Acropora cervicornis]